jgi:hypothetical protein
MDSKFLLQMTPAEALVALVNWENATGFRPDGLVPGTPTAIEGTTTQVPLTARRASALLDVVPDPGSFIFQFERLDSRQVLQGYLGDFRPSMPTSTQVVLDAFTARTGQLFYPEDFVQEYIDRENADPYTLQAKPESLRWIGSVAIKLGDWPRLDTYLADATPLPFLTVPAPLELASGGVAYRHINATPQLALVQALEVGQRAQEVAGIVSLFNQVAGASSSYVNAGQTPWTVSLTPGPYNLYNATVEAIAEPITGTDHAHPTNVNLIQALVVRLDLTYCTNFSDALFYFPYQPDHTPISTFSDQPRMRQLGVVSISDGTADNVRLNGYAVGSLLVDFPSEGLMLAGPDPWVTQPGVRTVTNLYNAAVQYNGARRSQDVVPATVGLNRVLVVTVDETSNQAYRGNLSFYYRAPVLVDETLPVPRVGVVYTGPLNPRGSQGPYTSILASGTLPAGLSLSGNQVTGTPITVGTSTFVIGVTDALGVRVDYTYRLTVTA